MKKLLLPAVLLAAMGAAFMTSSAKDSDPTVMTVNGKNIPLSEFTYLYNKNNSQQMQPVTVDEYVDMFVNYKLKVAEAEALGIDTTEAFLSEFNRYRDELAAPYMSDKAVEDSLVQEVYRHMGVNRDVNYIMMFGGRSPMERQIVKERCDSIRNVILAGDATFAEMADKFSVDKNGGHMGWMQANKYPYEFERAVYNTPIGEISPVQEFSFGYFIVRPDAERQDPGQVHVRHILKQTRGLSPEEAAAKKAQIDSIYTLLIAGADFKDIAKRESEDPGSSNMGGDLSWFGEGQMVKPFEEASFALADGEISQPIESPFGWHIIQKLGSRGVPAFDEVSAGILQNIQHDSRAKMAAERKLSQYKKMYKGQLNAKTLKNLKKQLDKSGVDSVAIASLMVNASPIASVGDRVITVADAAQGINFTNLTTTFDVCEALKGHADFLLDEATREYALGQLANIYPEYRNIINEYHDGMLFYEVSNQNVWERSTKDTEGLENFFKAHRADYSWDRPRYKGYVVFTPNDSIGAVVKDYIAELGDKSVDEIIADTKAKFSRNVKIERVLAPKGDNAIIDYMVFDGPKPEKVSKQWPSFFPFAGKIIDQPEDAGDVKGQAAADYQQVLENEWVETLRAKYPVTINHNALKSLK